MSKTAEETLRELYLDFLKSPNAIYNGIPKEIKDKIVESDADRFMSSASPIHIQSMHTYALQQAEQFGIWLLGNCDMSAICWYYNGEQKTTSELYQIYLTQQNQK